MAQILLKSIAGEHVLTGWDTGSDGDAEYLTLQLDGRAYTFLEKVVDSYRSELGTITIDDREVRTTFGPFPVLIDPWRDTDHATVGALYRGKTVAEVGTLDSNDYYPVFVARIYPENLGET